MSILTGKAGHPNFPSRSFCLTNRFLETVVVGMAENGCTCSADFGNLRKKMRLEVPLFQRQYVWSRDHQWEPLWEDISRKFAEHIEGRQNAPVHFLGAMVLDQKQTPTTHVERRQVIDGQQRLTTLQIFISAFRDFCREQEIEDLARECDNYTSNKGMMADSEVDRFKVWPTQLDRGQFMDVILSGSKKEIETRHPKVWPKYARKPNPRPRMIEAYLFFYEELKQFFVGTASEPALLAQTSLSARLEECFNALRSSLQVVTIDLQPSDDAQVIFETLNARGEPLLPADLLRNYIFLRASRTGQDQEALYDRYWKRFDDEFWRTEVKQGRLVRPRSDLFLQHFLASRIGEDIPVKHLYVEYRNWLDNEKPFNGSVEAELKTLARQGDQFRRIMEPTPGDVIYQLSTFLDAFDIRTAYPLLLLLLDSELSHADWLSISAALQSYLLRRAVIGFTTKNYNRVFLQLTKGLRRDGVNSDNLTKQLLSLTGDSSEWPTDAQFNEAWLKRPLYELGNARLVYLFGRLNETYYNGKAEQFNFTTQPTIEHLMPQAWIAKWPLPDGSKGLSHLNQMMSNDDDALALASQTRDRTVQTLGNLTLLMKPLNSTQSNSAWSEKQPEMIKHSLLALNQELIDVPVWDEAAIQVRAAMLFERAKKVWFRR